MEATLTRTNLDGLDLVHRGKVRDVYEVGEHLLIVATDRVSAYDVVLDPGIPDKGRVLTALSCFWFDILSDVVPNHLVTAEVADMPEAVRRHASVLEGRTMLVRRLQMFPVECVARGYLTGSGWRDYRETGAVCGHVLPADLPESTRLDPPLFTPATKAEEGHDENIDFASAVAAVGQEVAETLRALTLEVYGRAREFAAERGILIADTKFEFGRDADGRIVIGDEVLTPDSSRFWEASTYAPGRSQQPLDKQLVRDWLDGQAWDHAPPAPRLSDEVVTRTAATYRNIYERLTGRPLA
ncbi:MAG: phosphoribosylaminoimidazolesuccinocarboxamide synthase [Planctomycetota bacterium]|jgi:phosphoribosylaminoimidazole-succinocarboxamide synthase